MKKEHSSRLIGAILLITGTTIGAGILALPVSAGRAGFFPSVFAMIACWLFLVFSALCILEVCLALNEKGLLKNNLISMSFVTLGKWGERFSWVAYLFLLYALNTAYIAISTTIVQDGLSKITGYTVAHIFCVVPLLVAFGLLLKQGIQVVDQINRLLMCGLIVSFVCLLLFSFFHLESSNLTTIEFRFIISSFSTILTAFGFHIVIPSLVTYLHGNARELRLAIWIGSGIPCLAYILWQAAILGVVPQTGPISIESAYKLGMSGTDLLTQVAHFPGQNVLSQSFALFVILTSFIGVSLSLFDFLRDGLKLEKRPHSKWLVFFFTFVPPLYFALESRGAFFSALEYAGAFGVVILLALIPALMVWRKRYILKLDSPYTVGGGKIGLLLLMIISVAIIVCEILLKLHIVQ